MTLRTLGLAALLIALLTAAASASFVEQNLEILEPNLTLTIQTLNTASPAQLISVEGEETFIASGDRIVSDPAVIRLLLEEDTVRASGYAQALAEARLRLSTLQQDRLEPEANCSRLTGLDKFPCTDRDSCVRAAFSTPLAADFVNAPGFWQAMLRWTGERSDANASLSAMQSTLDAAANTSSDASALAARMAEARAKFVFFQNNSLYRVAPKCNTQLAACKAEIKAYCEIDDLFTCFEYCPRAPFDEAGWKTLEGRLGKASDGLRGVSAQAARAQTLANRSAAWIEYAKNRPSLWTAARKAIQAKVSAIDAALAASQSRWKDESLSAAHAQYKARFAQMGEAAGEGQYYKAIKSKDEMTAAADALLARIEANDKAAGRLEQSLRSINVSLSALAGVNGSEEEAAALSAERDALRKELAPPMEAAALEAGAVKAAGLEQKSLAAVARYSLGLPKPQTPGVGAGAGANASANASPDRSPAYDRLPPTPTGDAPGARPPAACPLPLLVMGGILALLTVVRRREG